ncbi:MAG TPA: TRAP transporter small permease subunit [Casimicrobiaceae bacterium]|nr:TRAP transporter small permease subunit [Casimicrobiaceae bacterium]
MIAALDRVAAVVACALVVGLLVVVSLGVVTREMGAPLIWTDELSRFVMVWLAVFGWILASRKRIQVRIRYFQDHLPARAHAAVEFAIQAGLVVLGGLIAAYSVGLVVRNHDLEATSLPLSMAWMYVPMVLAGVVTALQGLVELIQCVRAPRRKSAGAPVEVA